MLGIKMKKIRPLQGAGSRDVIGVDLSGSTFKLVHLSDSLHRAEIVNIFQKDISGMPEQDLPKLVSSCLSQLGAKNPHIIDIIPSNVIITKNIEIPSIDHREIKEIVNLQASRHTPYSREEIIIDYIEIGSYKNSYTKVLLVIATRSLIKKHFELFNRTGFKLEKVVIESEGLALSASSILKIQSKDSPINLIHIDANSSDFIIVFKEKALFVRNIPIGATHLISQDERYKLRFQEEVKKSLEAYQSENIEKLPESLILTGAIENLRGLEQTIGNVLNLQARAEPYQKYILLSENAKKALSATTNTSFFNIISPLLTSRELKVDLIPEEVRLRKSLEERGRELIKTGIFTLAFLILIFSILINKIYFKTAYLKNLKMEYETIDKKAQGLEATFAKVAEIKNYLTMRGHSLEVLAELHKLVPLNLRLNDIRFDDEGKFSLRGTSRSMSIVFAFVSDMENSKYFKEVKTRHTTKRKEGDSDVTDFEIICLITKETE